MLISVVACSFIILKLSSMRKKSKIISPLCNFSEVKFHSSNLRKIQFIDKEYESNNEVNNHFLKLRYNFLLGDSDYIEKELFNDTREWNYLFEISPSFEKYIKWNSLIEDLFTSETNFTKREFLPIVKFLR